VEIRKSVKPTLCTFVSVGIILDQVKYLEGKTDK
jgi:hypothetical protein